MKKKNIYAYAILSFLLILSVFLSLAIGAKNIPFSRVIETLTIRDKEDFIYLVIYERIPRTILGLLAGAALAVSGLLMQSITRNPIADSGILGINSGAALFVVIGIAFFNISNALQYILLAISGSLLSSILIYGIGNIGSAQVTPIKLAISGTAISIAMNGLVSAIMMPRNYVVDQFRFWQVGSIGGANFYNISFSLPLIALAFLSALFIAPALDILELGDEMATGLGTNPKLIRFIAAFCGVVLCATTTAICGPIAFVGLMIPHLIKNIIKANNFSLIIFSALAGACLLLISDIFGRILGRPGEVEVGIITAIIGSPIFILIAMNSKMR